MRASRQLEEAAGGITDWVASDATEDSAQVQDEDEEGDEEGDESVTRYA